MASNTNQQTQTTSTTQEINGESVTFTRPPPAASSHPPALSTSPLPPTPPSAPSSPHARGGEYVLPIIPPKGSPITTEKAYWTILSQEGLIRRTFPPLPGEDAVVRGSPGEHAPKFQLGPIEEEVEEEKEGRVGCMSCF
ncbi:hypothetical protein DXG03_002548 [Asterophora parasitica]|uniref:Uncharacterized protein n=1 Tax=Asterophora parasitica TaxID=117018 RepID=A0A9P7G3S7_9AGAR|nr:hypothetical protein DXG03_002548 [Asterophora parasitica]